MNIAAKNLTPTVTTGPLPASRKIYIPGDIHPTSACRCARSASTRPRASRRSVVYDSSGPYTIDGAHPHRPRPVPAPADWVIARGDVEAYPTAAMSRPKTTALPAANG
jgi:phosphomethylpyrimidine synthase